MSGDELEKMIEEAHGWRPDRPSLSQANCAGPTPEIRACVLDEVSAERRRQDAKWGEQNHSGGTKSDWWREFGIRASDAIEACNNSFTDGRGTWAHILIEEVAEAMDAEGSQLREELIQVAAVAVAWVESMDRRMKALEMRPNDGRSGRCGIRLGGGGGRMSHEDNLERFKLACPDGSVVDYWPSTLSGPVRVQVIGEPWLLSGHTPVVRLSHRPGCFSISHIQTVVQTGRWRGTMVP